MDGIKGCDIVKLLIKPFVSFYQGSINNLKLGIGQVYFLGGIFGR